MKNTEKVKKFWNKDRRLFVLLISLAILIFIVYPFEQNINSSSIIVNIFFIIIFFSAVFYVDISFRKKIVLFNVGCLIIVAGIAGNIFDNNLITSVHIISRLVFLWIVVVLIFHKVFGESLPFAYRIAGSVTIYLLIGFIWANMYFIVYYFFPDAFHFEIPVDIQKNLMINFIYFSFETLTTLGLGDIIPVSPLLKSLVIIEAVIGPLYLAVTIGRLVSKEHSEKKSIDKNNSQ